MRYVSTRGSCPPVGFDGALLGGLAPDGGLFVPETWPSIDVHPSADRYVDVAVEVLAPYVAPVLARDELHAMVEDAYATFSHPDVCPVRPLGDVWLLELFWGPTLAFKDVALQLVGRMMDRELTRRDERATILVATSGDTGSAAIEACRGRERVDIVVLHPAGRVSEVQRRQMTTVDEPNVHNVAVDGDFDTCQDLVKASFADTALRRRPQPVGHELHQLGPGDGPGRLLRDLGRGRRPRREPGVVLGAHRELRQRAGRLGRGPGRPPRRPAGGRLQPQRRPHPVDRLRGDGDSRRSSPR